MTETEFKGSGAERPQDWDLWKLMEFVSLKFDFEIRKIRMTGGLERETGIEPATFSLGS